MSEEQSPDWLLTALEAPPYPAPGTRDAPKALGASMADVVEPPYQFVDVETGVTLFVAFRSSEQIGIAVQGL